MLQIGRSLVRFFIDIKFFRSHYGPGVDSASNRNEYRECFLGVKAEEIKSRLRSGNARYHSVQNLLFSRLLSKNLKIKIHRTIILPVVGVKLGR